MVFFLFVENCLVERDECSRMSRIESLPYSLSNTAIDDLLGLALVRGPWNARLSERRARRGAGLKRRRRPNGTCLNLCWNASAAQVHFGEQGGWQSRPTCNRARTLV